MMKANTALKPGRFVLVAAMSTLLPLAAAQAGGDATGQYSTDPYKAGASGAAMPSGSHESAGGQGSSAFSGGAETWTTRRGVAGPVRSDLLGDASFGPDLRRSLGGIGGTDTN